MTVGLSFILVLGIFLQGSYGFNFSCTGDKLIVSVNATDGLFNYSVAVINRCAPKQLTGSGDIQTVELDCDSSLIGDGTFQISFIEPGSPTGILNTPPVLIERECPSVLSLTFSLQISPPSDMDDGPDEFVTGVRTTDLTMTVVSPVTTVGDPNLIIITPGPEDLNTYRMFLDRARLISSSGYYDIVLDGCVNPPAGSDYVLFGPPSMTGSFFLIFNTIIPIGNGGPVRSPEVVRVEALIKLCLIADADECIEILGCGNFNRVGRRKREASVEIGEVKTNGMMQVFMSTEDAQDKIQRIVAEESDRLTAPPVDENKLCVSRTLSYVVVAILIIGLILGFLATIWLTVKVRQTQKNIHNTSSERSLRTTSLKSSSRK